ncbi:MAG: phosphoglycerate dehydrogenase [Magnetococcales bacterium]|nr:phosphoglycerate dehydrogenase [Magnetococcales bacterium]
MKTILATTSTFAEESPDLVDRITRAGFRLIRNPFGRKLTQTEVTGLLAEHHPSGLLAGLEPLGAEVLQPAAAQLRVISRIGVGWDNVDREAAARLGITVFRTPDAVTPAVVELTVAFFLALARHLSHHDRLLRQGKWQRRMGFQIRGKRLGLVGCGRIGKGVAKAMQALGASVMAFDPWVDAETMKSIGITPVENIEALIAASDLLSLHASSGSEKGPILTADRLRLALPHLLLVNTARGGLIDETALLQALVEKRIAGAGLDVFAEEPYTGPLRERDEVILTPHIGSYSAEARRAMEEEAVDNLLTALTAA